MNTLIVPFHDWRKIILEGSRTRDAHFIETFRKKNSDITVVVNRPTTALEINLKRKPNLINHKVILKKGGFKLYQIDAKFYVIDFVSKKLISQVTGKYLWFVEQYGHKKYIDFITEALKVLKIENEYCLLNQNIFAFKLTQALKPACSVFDAWDNFLKFDVYKSIEKTIEQGYKAYGECCDFWITNSQDNIESFQEPFNPKQLFLIKNGVDLKRFVNGENSNIPADLKEIPKPIIGFGGKITHLLDVNLINDTMKQAEYASFVFVGQILNKEVYNAIHKLPNFYYLGDKHYDEYPNYVKNFDICIVPYVIDEAKKSGANSIKVYEYLATNKKVIGTNSNGLEDLKDYLYIINNSEGFTAAISNIDNEKLKLDITEHSWQYKFEQLNSILRDYI